VHCRGKGRREGVVKAREKSLARRADMSEVKEDGAPRRQQQQGR
jgi:hypothetical protein